MAKVGLIQYSTTPANNTDINSVNVNEGCPPSGINNAIRQAMSDLAQRLGTSFTLASATTPALGDQEEEYGTISGTTTITGFGTPGGGGTFGFEVMFSGALTLTHNATSLILPGGANIVTAAGDTARFRHEGSGNWRCLWYVPATGVGALGGTTATAGKVLTANGSGSAPSWQTPTTGSYAAKTSGYTIIGTDRTGVIDFTTAGATATLTAAATLGSGFCVTIMNTASTGDVTIDPNSTETLDGLTTRLLRPGDRVEIVCDGANWKTKRGYYSYDSGAQTVTTGGTLTLAHGLGVTPALDSIECTLTNVTGEANWTTGQVMKIPFGGYQNAAEANNFTMQPDATNLNLRYGSTAIAGVNRTTGAIATLTAANWTLRVKARAVY